MKVLIIKGEKSKPTCPCVEGPLPLNLKAGSATLSSNDCNQMFVMTWVNSTMSLLQMGGHFGPSSLQSCCNSATLEDFPERTTFLRSCHSIKLGFRSGLWPGLSKVSILLDMLRLVGAFWVIVLLQKLSVSTETAPHHPTITTFYFARMILFWNVVLLLQQI